MWHMLCLIQPSAAFFIFQEALKLGIPSWVPFPGRGALCSLQSRCELLQS
jgi:hypothetical protein